MDEITQFVAMPYDLTEQGLVAGEPVRCASPASAIEHAKHLWKVFGHAGAAAIVRAGYPETRTIVLRTYGVVPDIQSDEHCHPD